MYKKLFFIALMSSPVTMLSVEFRKHFNEAFMFCKPTLLVGLVASAGVVAREQSIDKETTIPLIQAITVSSLMSICACKLSEKIGLAVILRNHGIGSFLVCYPRVFGTLCGMITGVGCYKYCT